MSIIRSIIQDIKSPYLLKRSFSLNSVISCSSNSVPFQYDSDPGPKFMSSDIQKLLKSITQMNLEKVFRKRSVPDNSIEYQFMTTEQLEKKFLEIAKRAEEYLHMPPVTMMKKDEHKVISQDPGLKNFSDTKLVITDITFGLKQSKRKVVIRQTDGTLEYAAMDIQKRMNQLYFPLIGRKIRTPRMFETEHLKRCLNEHKYEFLLDRLCIQFEVYEKDFHEISSKVYTHINENKKFDDLRSTRHFGPMAFFLAWHKIIDDLLYDMIKRDYLQNGVEVIALMYQINNIDYDKSIHEELNKFPKYNTIVEELKKSINSTPDDIHEEIKTAIGKSGEHFECDDICLEFIESYVKNKALKKVPLELAIQTFKETNDEKRRLYEGLLKAHGIN